MKVSTIVCQDCNTKMFLACCSNTAQDSIGICQKCMAKMEIRGNEHCMGCYQLFGDLFLKMQIFARRE